MATYKKTNVFKRQQERKNKELMRKALYKINENIDSEQVRVVEINGEKVNEVYKLDEAIKLAEEKGLDLVAMPSKSDMPVCKIVSVSKFFYDQEKKDKQKNNNNSRKEKAVSFSPDINDNDFDVKKKHVEGFLKEGLQVKCSLFFCGRAVTFKDFGFNKMNQFIDDLKEFCEPSAEPVFDGKKAITVTLIPRGKKNNAVKT